MKKTWMIVMAVCAAFLFTACGKSEKNTESVANTGTETTAPATEATEAVSQEAPGNGAEFKILTGKVREVADNLGSMTIQSGDKELIFDLSGAGVETTFALEPEVTVTVIYKGEISGSDAANAKPVLILDGQENMKVQELTGSVVDQAMSTFTIQPESGTEVGFIKDNCEGLDSDVLGTAANDSNGSGAKVKVTYVTVTYDAGSMSNFPLRVEAVK
ncbi:hypothetical protein [Lacrimispora saccharolytica]|uniref:Lipoprotein n=1 Tax=Lacrimispora saccharolytica (strain ATCC 35040 / DSM 2544 / NRCC 2533 / WM1) TaxID=610130 RepID=D9R2L1_LACSW|nr:hypothetical protein [Lacrimispora saccharolytica]ADL06635.1 hypothetical protein Closa_4129 [[Clostridium] saccharolyticum WM1]QRV19293.1 hypothetical protein I6K70_17820 [Lacrimispora saccharolytica]